MNSSETNEAIRRGVGDYLKLSASLRMGDGVTVEAITGGEILREAGFLYPGYSEVINVVANLMGVAHGIVASEVVGILKKLSGNKFLLEYY